MKNSLMNLGSHHEEKEKAVRSVQELETKSKGKTKVAELVQGDNAYIGLVELGPGASVPLHRDTTEEYLYVLSGSGTITIDGESFSVKTGSAVYMPREAAVSYQNSNETTSRFIQVFAGPEPGLKYRSWKKSTFQW